MAETVAQIKDKLKRLHGEALAEALLLYEGDARGGVRTAVAQARRQEEQLAAEHIRLQRMQVYEEQYQDCNAICGIDEVGRGPLAGPVMAAAVILPKAYAPLYLNDSKQLSEAKREALYEQLMEHAVAVGIGSVSQEEIDRINILQATYVAMQKAIAALPIQPDMLLVDAVTIPRVQQPQLAIIRGDAKSVSIAAASVIAKVTRDRLMREYDAEYPMYGFAENKGYGSQAHIAALQRYGACPLHRKSFITKLMGEADT